MVPTISIYEVFRRLLREPGGEDDLCGSWRRCSAGGSWTWELRLPMADAVILATARALGGTLWTQDADFEGIAGVRYVVRKEG